MAGRAVLRFVIIHRHFKHVVAADAHAMDFRPSARRVMTGSVSSRRGRCRSRRRFRLWLRCLAHAMNFITMRNANAVRTPAHPRGSVGAASQHATVHLRFILTQLRRALKAQPPSRQSRQSAPACRTPPPPAAAAQSLFAKRPIPSAPFLRASESKRRRLVVHSLPAQSPPASRRGQGLALRHRPHPCPTHRSRARAILRERPRGASNRSRLRIPAASHCQSSASPLSTLSKPRRYSFGLSVGKLRKGLLQF